MRSRTFLYPRRAAGSDQRQTAGEEKKRDRSGNWRRAGLAAGLSLLLIPLSEADLFAQQAPYYPQPDYDQQQSYPSQQQPYYPQQQQDSGYPQQQPDYSQQQPDYPGQEEPQAAYPDAGQGYPQQEYPQAQDSPEEGSPQPQYAPQPPLSASQLEQMVAPIALFPDGLLAEVLAASTYPLQITEANQWRQAQGNASPEQIAAEANVQDWDPSVKALVAFPQVLSEMAQSLQWTTNLGNAYYNQPQDVMSAVQSMRQRARAAGTLETTPQETVTENQGYVEVAPANPQIVYVPEYNPWAVYGEPVAPYPGFSAGAAFGSFVAGAVVGGVVAPVVFGVGMVMSAFAHMAWGFFGWGLGWGNGAVFFHGEGYCPHSWSVRDWGLDHGGPRYWSRFERAGYGRGGYYGRGGFNGRGGSFGRGGAYARGGGYGRGGYANAYGRGGAAYGRAGVGQYGHGFAENRGAQGFRGGQYGGYGRNTQAYNHMPTFNTRSYARPGGSYGGAYSRSAGSYRSGSYGRPGAGTYGRTPNFGAGSYGHSGWGTANRGFGMTGQQPRMGSGTMQAYRGGSFAGYNQGYRGSASSFRQPSFGGGGFAGRSSSHGFSGGYSGGMSGGHSSGGHFGGGHFGGGGGHFSSHGGGGHFGGGGHGGGHGGGRHR